MTDKAIAAFKALASVNVFYQTSPSFDLENPLLLSEEQKLVASQIQASTIILCVSVLEEYIRGIQEVVGDRVDALIQANVRALQDLPHSQLEKYIRSRITVIHSEALVDQGWTPQKTSQIVGLIKECASFSNFAAILRQVPTVQPTFKSIAMFYRGMGVEDVWGTTMADFTRRWGTQEANEFRTSMLTELARLRNDFAHRWREEHQGLQVSDLDCKRFLKFVNVLILIIDPFSETFIASLV